MHHHKSPKPYAVLFVVYVSTIAILLVVYSLHRSLLLTNPSNLPTPNHLQLTDRLAGRQLPGHRLDASFTLILQLN